jgi:hypothetical protein
LGDVLQDAQCEPEAGDPIRLRLVSSPSASLGQGTVRSAHETHPGHFNYFGIRGNFRSLLLVIEQVKRIWYKWLCRRSQRKRLTWERFADLLRDFPLPRPRIMVRIWGS